MLDGFDLEGDLLRLKIKYGGGCGDTELSAFWDGTYMLSIPGQIDVQLVFFDEDYCEALVHQEYLIDLSEIEEPTIIHVSMIGSDEELFTVQKGKVKNE